MYPIAKHFFPTTIEIAEGLIPFGKEFDSLLSSLSKRLSCVLLFIPFECCDFIKKSILPFF